MNNIILRDAISSFINSSKTKGRLSLQTIRYYERYLKRFLAFIGENLPVKKLSIKLVEDYQAFLNTTGLDASSINLALISLRQLLKYLQRSEIVTLSPIFVESPKVRTKPLNFPTQEEIKKLLQACEVPSNKGIRNRALLELMLSSGLRVSELCSVEVNKLELTYNRTIVVGKRDKERLVLFSQDASDWIQKYLRTRKKSSPYLFFISPRQVERILQNLSKKAGVKIHPHLLRHSFGTETLNKGVNIYDLQRLMGHSSIATTERYLHASNPHLEEVYKKAWNSPKNIPTSR